MQPSRSVRDSRSQRQSISTASILPWFQVPLLQTKVNAQPHSLYRKGSLKCHSLQHRSRYPNRREQFGLVCTSMHYRQRTSRSILTSNIARRDHSGKAMLHDSCSTIGSTQETLRDATLQSSLHCILHIRVAVISFDFSCLSNLHYTPLGVIAQNLGVKCRM